MANETGDEFRRPIPLALAGLAAIGWLAALYIWWQASQTEWQITDSLHAAQQARESLAADGHPAVLVAKPASSTEPAIAHFDLEWLDLVEGERGLTREKNHGSRGYAAGVTGMLLHRSCSSTWMP